MKKQIFANSIIYLICIVAACLLNLAVRWILVKFVDVLFDIDFYAASIVRVVSGFLTVGVVLGGVCFYESYKSVEYHPLTLTASVLLAGVMHLLLGLLLMFHPFIAGGVSDLAGLLSMGEYYTAASKIKDIYLWAYLASFGINLAFQTVTALVCGALGKHTRIKNREALLNAKPTANREERF